MDRTLPIERVLSMFFDLTGETGTDDWLGFCLASVENIMIMLRADADIAANETRLCYSAACHAMYMYVLRGNALDAADFKAVDLSITPVTKLTVSSAKLLFEESLKAISPLLKPSGFAFRTV